MKGNWDNEKVITKGRGELEGEVRRKDDDIFL